MAALLWGFYLIETLAQRVVTSIYEEAGIKMFTLLLFTMIKKKKETI